MKRERKRQTHHARTLERILGRLRRRSMMLIALRALLGFMAGCGALLLLAAALLGPIVSPVSAVPPVRSRLQALQRSAKLQS